MLKELGYHLVGDDIAFDGRIAEALEVFDLTRSLAIVSHCGCRACGIYPVMRSLTGVDRSLLRAGWFRIRSRRQTAPAGGSGC